MVPGRGACREKGTRMKRSRRLAAEVDGTSASLAEMEKTVADAGGDPDDPRTRRQLLTIAGTAVLGGAGLLIAGADPASAANGDTWTVGGSLTGTNTTSLSGSFGTLGPPLSLTNSNGIGLVTGGTGEPDLKLNGTGILAMTNAATGNAQPGLSPFVESLAMSDTGVLWAGDAQAGWKRVNAVRVDNPDGSGNPFSPFRLFDTRDNSGQLPQGSSPYAGGSTHNIPVINAASIPDNAVAIFGNVTTVLPNYTGFLTMFPQGTTQPTVANLNFVAGQVNSNFFLVGLSNAGGLSIFVNGGAGNSVNVAIDIFAYVQ